VWFIWFKCQLLIHYTTQKNVSKNFVWAQAHKIYDIDPFLRPFAMGLLNGCWKLLNHWRRAYWRWGGRESRWMVSICWRSVTGATCCVRICWNWRVQYTRRQGAWSVKTRREKLQRKKRWNTWCVITGCLNFYLLNNLDSIISLQIIIIIFFTKIHDFFSLQIETWIIWFGHRKKIKFFLLS